MDSGITKSFLALGTFNSITAFGCKDEQPLALVEARVKEIESRMSVFQPGSDIRELNNMAGRGMVRLHGDTFAVLSRAAEISVLSGGAFDCTVRPLVELWGVGKKDNFIPSVRQITETLPQIGYKSLIVDKVACSVGLSSAGMAVDLGGIAKGYAADEARRILLENGVKSAMINLGGNILAIGNRPDGQPWRIGIQDPLSVTGRFLAVIDAVDQAVVTSGANERFFIEEGVRYHHILDPRTGWPAASGLLSATVVSGCSMDADALSTALFVLGRERGMKLMETVGAQALCVSEDLEICATAGLAGNMEIVK